MSDSWKIFLEKTLEGYRNSYDIEKASEEDSEIVARAHFHVTEGQHFLLKEVEMWSADSDEYVYFFHIGDFNDQKAQEVIETVQKEGEPHIQLNHLSFRKQHMCTRLVAVVIADNASDEACKRFKKSRIYKSFQFSLKGWMEVHTVVVDLGKGSVISNRYGKETANYLKKIISCYKQGNA